MAERYRDELRAEIPEIDAGARHSEVPEIVGALAGTGKSGFGTRVFRYFARTANL
jgi:hypothetical protein